MKRIGSSDSLGALMSMCPTTEEHSPGSNHIYNNREYQSMLDEEGCIEELGHVPEKKRRLSVDQVKALERNFEVENKLEPERKVKLAQELGLQPRQVAVWFQNRRARWKTKQLERDYGVLKANFESLQQNYESLKLDKQALLKEIKELKSKLNEENPEEDMPIKEEAFVSESDNKTPNKATELVTTQPVSLTVGSQDVNLKRKSGSVPFVSSEFKLDGPSDSDSSAILNDDQSPNASNSSSGAVQNQQVLVSKNSSSFRFNSPSSSSPPSINCFSFSDSRSEGLGSAHDNVYHPQFVKMEEHNFLGGEEACNFFAEEQAPTLHWYCADQWA